VAATGLLPAELSHEIESHPQRPLAIPGMEVWIAREGDVLPEGGSLAGVYKLRGQPTRAMSRKRLD